MFESSRDVVRRRRKSRAGRLGLLPSPAEPFPHVVGVDLEVDFEPLAGRPHLERLDGRRPALRKGAERRKTPNNVCESTSFFRALYFGAGMNGDVTPETDRNQQGFEGLGNRDLRRRGIVAPPRERLPLSRPSRTFHPSTRISIHARAVPRRPREPSRTPRPAWSGPIRLARREPSRYPEKRGREAGRRGLSIA